MTDEHKNKDIEKLKNINIITRLMKKNKKNIKNMTDEQKQRYREARKQISYHG